MIQASVPELADGGYWYLVEAVPDPDKGGQTPGFVPGGKYCAWYSGNFAAIRTPEPVSGIKTADGNVSQALSGGKPYGRIRGD